MSKKSRRIIFYALVLFFLIAGSATIFYAEGWRLAFPQLKLEKVGGLYISVHPSGALIYLDGRRAEEKPGLFQDGILINNLLPGSYKLDISESGYQNFSQSAAVVPSMVTKLEKIVLAPAEANAYIPSPTSTAPAIKDFWVVGQENMLIKIGSQLILNGQKIKGRELLGETPDNQNLLTFDPSLGNYYLTDLSSATASVDLTAFAKNYFPKLNSNIQFFADNQDAGLLIVKSENYWGAFDISKYQINSLPYPALKNIYAEIKKVYFNGSQIYILESSGILMRYDNSSAAENIMAGGVKDFSVSPDGSQVAALKSDSILIFESGDASLDSTFTPADIKNAGGLTWYSDNSHLFVVYPDKVNFLSLDDQKFENYQTISAAAKAAYFPALNYLYVLEKGKIYYFQFPQ